MKTVAIKTLRAKLGEYVRMAKAGETILVTERGEVVAEPGPARRQPRTAEDLDERFEALASEHEMTLRSVEGSWAGPKAVVQLPGFASEAVLDSLRGR